MSDSLYMAKQGQRKYCLIGSHPWSTLNYAHDPSLSNASSQGCW